LPSGALAICAAHTSIMQQPDTSHM
jgi:hypothetical protein